MKLKPEQTVVASARGRYCNDAAVTDRRILTERGCVADQPQRGDLSCGLGINWTRSVSQRAAAGAPTPHTAALRRKDTPANDCRSGRRYSRNGIALIITLIMLSVITFLTVAFLALSRRNVASSGAARSQTDAKLASDTALARGVAEVTTRILASQNPFNYDLMVSRNYINPVGFIPGNTDLTNVSYVYADGLALSGDDQIQNIANLFYDSRPPVYIPTNGLGSNDFRFYLDFNRNRRFETNGLGLEIIDEIGNVRLDTNGIPITSLWVGDPEWIGVLQKPEYPHSPTNYFVSRYAFLVMPSGKSLDVNFMHNAVQGTMPDPPPGQTNMTTGNPPRPISRFKRNQGFGTWELNLGAFLKDWNTSNYYYTTSYVYEADTIPNEGHAFWDASAFLRYRYDYNIINLPTAYATLGDPAVVAFTNDFIDDYANGPFLLTTNNLNQELNGSTPRRQTDDTDYPWPGSRNPKAFTDVQEFFDTNKLWLDWHTRLTNSGAKTNFYERYSFYRLLTQLGVDSRTNNTFTANGETYRKININYDNIFPNTNGFVSPTNFFDWRPNDFFFYAADALIKKSLIRVDATNWFLIDTNWQQWTNGRANLTNDMNWIGTNVQASPYWVGTNFSLTNIQIYPPRTNCPLGQYTPALHRLLQLAANVHAATTNGFQTNATGVIDFPYVFRPIFRKEGTNIFITGYEEETSTNIGPFFDLATFVQQTNNVSDIRGTNFYGIPWIISAKKGFPNFNEFSLETVFRMTRRLELVKPGNPPQSTNFGTFPSEINQMYTVGITNYLGLEFWNSYLRDYARPIRITYTNVHTADLRWTNQFGTSITNSIITFGKSVVLPNGLRGATRYTELTVNPGSFYVPVSNRVDFLSEAVYRRGGDQFELVKTNFLYGTDTNRFEKNQCYTPNWHLTVSNRLFCVIEDIDANRIIDFVSFEGLGFTTNVTDAATRPPEVPGPATGGALTVGDIRDFFDRRTSRIYFTNFCTNITEGFSKQMRVSLGELPIGSSLWEDDRKDAQIARFQKFFGNLYGHSDDNYTPTNRLQAPYSPTIALYFKHFWQANDPLVHYMPADLQSQIFPPKEVQATSAYTQFSENNLGNINNRYSPWGGKRRPGGNPMQNETTDPASLYNLAIKDPRVRWSDEWDFPTNKFPSVGWLGRVHRGTPWQTVYLKSAVAEPNVWLSWTGGTLTTNEIGELKWLGGVLESHPTHDWNLLDVFTVGQNDNAIRGCLSVNQTNMAAWSAALSGVQVLTNSELYPGAEPLIFGNMPIEPTSWQLSNIVSSIYSARTNRPNEVFRSVGEILAADALTVNSPYLLLTNVVDPSNPDADQLKHGLTDTVVERIPQMTLSLLETDQPRVVIYAFGQSLKPAENSIVVRAPAGKGHLQNLCTNYQVTGEVVARAVLRLDPKIEWFTNALPNGAFARTNYHAVIENYRILPEEQ